MQKTATKIKKLGVSTVVYKKVNKELRQAHYYVSITRENEQ